MIEASGLAKEYGSTKALRGVSFQIAANEVVGLLGPNGAGKTTLMKILTGYIHPTEGTAKIAGHDVIEQPLLVQKHIGYLPENAPLYPDMLVQEALQMIAALRQLPEDSRPKAIAEAVQRTGLEQHLLRPISQLSKGYRQRVGLAQAILHGPRVLILDEPTNGLDPSQIVEIRQLIKDLARTATVLLSTHILSEVELTCERVLIITDGTLRTDARMEELRASNSAIVGVEADDNAAVMAFQAIGGVAQVSPIHDARSNGYRYFRVTGSTAHLCPAIFDVVKTRGWRLSELRPERHDLESVFRKVTERSGERS